MLGLAKTTADYTAAVMDNARVVGLSAEAYQELQYAMAQSGLSQDDFVRMMGRVNQRIGMARQGNEKYRKSLQALGISLEDLDKGLVGTEEAFIAMIDYLHQMEDSQQQAAVAGDFFGVMLARRMMPLIRDGAESVEELRQRAHELGLVMDDLAIAKGDLLSDTLDDLSFTAKGLGRIFGSEMHAPLINIGRAITDILARFSTWLTENPKVVRQIVMWGGAIAGVLGALVTLGTTMIVTGKIVGALGTIFNILTSKPMLIIAAIGALYLAWENDWLGIRTAVEDAWEKIEPVIDAIIEWGQKTISTVWNWTTKTVSAFLSWVQETAWPWIASTVSTAWDWTTGKVGEFIAWIKETAWPWIASTVSTAWDWTTGKVGEFIAWIKETAWPWIASTVSTAWDWTTGKVGEFIAWIKETAWPWIASTVSTAWDWTTGKVGEFITWIKDVAAPWFGKTVSTVWNWTLDVGGRWFDAIKKGFETGDWSDFWNITSDIWNAGVAIALSLQLVSGAASWILTAIGSIFGNSAGKLGIGGIPLAIGLLTVGIQLLEAQAEGSYEAFVKNVLVAALVGAIGGAVFGPSGALIGFNLTLSLKLGEKVEDVGKVIEDWGRVSTRS